ncbi:uncharacterized protein MYCGRDRAFT_103882, partial [Zymoseptoria tritici IPO323]
LSTIIRPVRLKIIPARPTLGVLDSAEASRPLRVDAWTPTTFRTQNDLVSRIQGWQVFKEN